MIMAAGYGWPITRAAALAWRLNCRGDMASILVIDDEENIRQSLKSALERRDHRVVTAADCAEGRRFGTAEFDLVLLDVMLPDGNGVDLLEELLRMDPRRAVVMISGHADVDIAVSAIRKGAHDFLEKPLSLDKVLVVLDNVTRSGRLRSEKERLSSRVYGEMVGESPAIERLRSDAVKAAARTSRFLITGENGTGKELVANLIHRSSRYADGPFVAVNCAALPSELVESELFGHLAGAFTGASKRRKGRFAEAVGGSIFLDEISEMPLEAQAKILRVIETNEFTPVGADRAERFDGNIIAASNRDLDKQVESGDFRQDLLYRLNVVDLKVPALRDRPKDIGSLARHFLSRFAEETGTGQRRLTEEAIDHLQRYPFPGNVRELKNLMERVNIYCDTGTVGVEDIRPLMPYQPQGERPSLREATRQFELDYIKSTIARCDGNMQQAARQLGLERSHLYKKLKQLDPDNGN
ncbi:response regulator [candidate division GN15 bacterium]|nr:response regulator [candidate division GN15 bacterium]